MIIRQTLVVLTALLSASACALAQTFSVGNLTYSVTDKTAGEVDVSSCESYESEIDVPATVSHGGISYKVTGIGITAFSVKSSLRRIGLPEAYGISEKRPLPIAASLRRCRCLPAWRA